MAGVDGCATTRLDGSSIHGSGHVATDSAPRATAWELDSCRNRSTWDDECSGPAPSKPWGNSNTNPVWRSHLVSLPKMKLSMMIWAPLAKSPNCASHRHRVRGACRE